MRVEVTGLQPSLCAAESKTRPFLVRGRRRPGYIRCGKPVVSSVPLLLLLSRKESAAARSRGASAPHLLSATCAFRVYSWLALRGRGAVQMDERRRQ